MSGILHWMREFLGVILLLITVSLLIGLFVTLYLQVRPSKHKQTTHKCDVCAKEFKCRYKLKLDRPVPAPPPLPPLPPLPPTPTLKSQDGEAKDKEEASDKDKNKDENKEKEK